MNESVQIEKLVYGGDAMARRAGGEVVFVRGGLPGESVAVEIAPKKKGAVHAQLKRVETVSPHRVTPPCSVFGKCGGCDWQHLEITEQRHWKTRIVTESLTRLGKFANPAVLPTLGGEPWQYRNKVQWVVVSGASPKLGYLAEESHTGVPFEACSIIPESFHTLKHWFEAHPQQLSCLGKLQIQANESDEWLLTFWPNGERPADLKTIAQEVSAAFTNVKGVIAGTSSAVMAGENRLRHQVGGQVFETAFDSFFQVNPDVTGKMLVYLDDVLPESMTSFLDVYCGVGLFALHLASRCEQVTGVEYAASAVALAEENARLNQITNARFIAGDAAKTLATTEETFEVALVDPPRKGCEPEVLEALTRCVTDELVYVSCNPATLARDLRLLVDQGWRLGTVQPFDMFPQTYHVETIASLFRD